MSKFVEKHEDKFHNKTELETQAITLWSASKLYDYGLSWQRHDVKGRFRYWSTPEGEEFLLDIHYCGPDWMYLREGDIVIRINNAKNIVLKPTGEDSNVTSNEGHKIICSETLCYIVSKSDFLDICEADSLECQISGRRTFINNVKSECLQALAMELHDNLYAPKYNGEEIFKESKQKENAPRYMTGAIFVAIFCGFFSGWGFWGSLYSEWLYWLGLISIPLFVAINHYLPYPNRLKLISDAVYILLFYFSMDMLELFF